MKVAGVKLVMDGAYSDRTAWTDDAYPGSRDHGLQTATGDDPWASPAPAQGGGKPATPNDPWATPGVSGGSDEPPF